MVRLQCLNRQILCVLGQFVQSESLDRRRASPSVSQLENVTAPNSLLLV